MEKKNSNTGKSLGKVSAVILILAFVGINFYRTEKNGGPLEQKFSEQRQDQIAARKFDQKHFPNQNIEKLKYAYTGNWKKNEVSAAAVAGDYAFTQPENTRGKVEATAAAKKADAKKKTKKVAKKKKDKKIAKKSKSRRSLFDTDYDDSESGYIATNYYTQPKQQTRTPSEKEEEKEPKKLSAREVYELVLTAKSIAPMSEALSKDTITMQTYYSVAGMLLSAAEDDLKKIGFEAIAAYQSANSLILYAKHIEDEMSPETKAFAESTLNVYNQPKYIRLLGITLKNSDNTLKIISSNLIRDITLGIMQSQAQSGENVVYNEQQILAFKSQLTVVRDDIEKALELSSLDSSVLASFNSTRDILNQFLD